MLARIGALAAAAWLAGLPVQTSAAPGVVPLAEGRAIYNFRCYFCHGYSGNARTVAASQPGSPP